VPWTVAEVLLGFVGTLRQAGIGADHRRVETMLRAVDALDVTDPVDVYWAGRLTLCAEPDDLARYDAAFRAYFGGARQRVPGRSAVPGAGAGPGPAGRAPEAGNGGPGGGAPEPVDGRPGGARAGRLVALFGAQTGPGAGSGAEAGEGEALRVAASGADVLRRRDVARLSVQERAEVRRLLALLRPAPAPRRSRRYRPGGGEVDPGRTVRGMLRHGGEAALLAHRRRRYRPRRLVLLVDVSGSMEPYADALLRLAHAAVRARPTGTEVFTVGTRLTRVTRALRARDPDAALAGCGRAIPDWSGGTRLGETLRAFLDRWGRRGTARQAVVVVASDGWERGDPALLGEQLARLSRLAYRLVWVNPHRGRPGYRPLTGGMAAALPHLDDFVAGHSFDALAELAAVIARR
jgi:uncharacterized protein with von Willebrand factor type A (vWA) domain